MAKKKKTIETDLTLQKKIPQKIFLVRGNRVMLDSDLAELYEVETRTLNQAVKRNIERFPVPEFMFQLTKEEFENLISQFVTSRWGGVRKLPYAFSEQGVAMTSSVLTSKKAIQVNIQIIKTFVRLRELLLAKTDLKRKVNLLEKKYKEHDYQIDTILDVIDQLLDSPKKIKKKIGY